MGRERALTLFASPSDTDFAVMGFAVSVLSLTTFSVIVSKELICKLLHVYNQHRECQHGWQAGFRSKQETELNEAL